jgi:hypothetical protein
MTFILRVFNPDEALTHAQPQRARRVLAFLLHALLSVTEAGEFARWFIQIPYHDNL